MRVSPLVDGQSLCTEGSRSCQWRPSRSWTASAPPSLPAGTRSVHPDQIHQACKFLRLPPGRRCPRCRACPFDTVSAWGSRQYTIPQECSFSWMSSDLTTNNKMLWHIANFLWFTYLHQNTPSYLSSLLRPLFSFWEMFFSAPGPHDDGQVGESCQSPQEPSPPSAQTSLIETLAESDQEPSVTFWRSWTFCD